MPSPANETATFTESSQALTAIVDQFRNQALPLEEALALFEKGIGYVRTCQNTLGNAKGKLKTLSQALAEVQTTVTSPSLRGFSSTALTEETPQTIAPTATINSSDHCYTWQHQQTLTLHNTVLDEAWLKQLLLTLKASLPFQTQGLPKLYERENQSGLEAFLPLANGWLIVSVWKPTASQQGKLHIQLQIAEETSIMAETFKPASLIETLTTDLH
jgi:exodeoxyribonuclease VII small subunit